MNMSNPNATPKAAPAAWMNIGDELPAGWKTVSKADGWVILGFTCKPKAEATRHVARRLIVAEALFGGADNAIVEAAMSQLVVDCSNNGGRKAVRSAAPTEAHVDRDVVVRSSEELAQLRTRSSADDVVKLVAQLRKAGASMATITAALSALEQS